MANRIEDIKTEVDNYLRVQGREIYGDEKFFTTAMAEPGEEHHYLEARLHHGPMIKIVMADTFEAHLLVAENSQVFLVIEINVGSDQERINNIIISIIGHFFHAFQQLKEVRFIRMENNEGVFWLLAEIGQKNSPLSVHQKLDYFIQHKSELIPIVS